MLLFLAAAARHRNDGHPLWHLLIVAGGAVGVFVVIKGKEHCERRGRPVHLRSDGGLESARALRLSQRAAPSAPILALAIFSAAAGAIHAAVTTEHFQEAFIYGAFFLSASTIQTGWSAVLVYRPNRRLLWFGVWGNAATVLLWVFTRTVGVPLGPHSGTEAIGTYDVVSCVLEVAIVVGAATILTRRSVIEAPDEVTQRLEALRTRHPNFIREHEPVTI